MIAELLPEIESATVGRWHRHPGSNGTSHTNGVPSPLWEERLNDLRAIQRLEDDWDGLGAPAPAADLLESAFRLAGLLREHGVAVPSRIVPGLTGTILFEWQDGTTYCEIEIDRPYHAELLILITGLAPERRFLAGE